MRSQEIFNFPVSRGSYSDFVQQISSYAQSGNSAYVCVANVHMVVEAHKDPAFANVIRNADIVTPDGKPLTWALKLLYKIDQDRVAGMDLLPDLLSSAVELNLPVYFMGGTDEMLTKTTTYVTAKYPGLQVAGCYSPPFRQLTVEETGNMITMVNDSGAKLIFVVLGCPKQEKWMFAMKGKIKGTMIGIGGALPVMTGMQKRAPGWMQRSGLEWLYRLAQEPRRLFKRYAVTNSIFLWLLIKGFIRIRIMRLKD